MKKIISVILIAGMLITTFGVSSLWTKETQEELSFLEEIIKELKNKFKEKLLRGLLEPKEEKIYYTYLPSEYSKAYRISHADLLASFLAEVDLLNVISTDEFSVESFTIYPDLNSLDVSVTFRYHPTQKSYTGDGYLCMRDSLNEAIREVLRYIKEFYPIKEQDIKISIKIENTDTTATFESDILRIK